MRYGFRDEHRSLSYRVVSGLSGCAVESRRRKRELSNGDRIASVGSRSRSSRSDGSIRSSRTTDERGQSSSSPDAYQAETPEGRTTDDSDRNRHSTGYRILIGVSNSLSERGMVQRIGWLHYSRPIAIFMRGRDEKWAAVGSRQETFPRIAMSKGHPLLPRTFNGPRRQFAIQPLSPPTL